MAVKKFLNIAAGLQTHSRSLNKMSVAYALSAQAEKIGLKTTSSENKLLLRDLIMASFPYKWLHSVILGINGSKREVFRRSIAKIIDEQGSVKETSFYILAAAVLFDSADEALTALLNASVDIQNQQRERDFSKLVLTPN